MTVTVWNACKAHLSRAVRRVVSESSKHAPEWIEFTPRREDADWLIAHVVGSGEIEDLQREHDDQRVIMWQYCHKTADVADWPAVWADVDMVASYYDLPTDRLYQTPLGVDMDVFYPMDVEKRYGIMATGYVAETECLREAYEACVALGVDFCHVGQDFDWGEHYCHFENVPDATMCRLYNESHLALATRRVEGFELPALEAAACATEFTCLDMADYRRWFAPLRAHWIDPRVPVQPQLTYLLSQLLKARGATRPATILSTCTWRHVMAEFWAEAERRLMDGGTACPG